MVRRSWNLLAAQSGNLGVRSRRTAVGSKMMAPPPYIAWAVALAVMSPLVLLHFRRVCHRRCR
eukprot:4151442-Pleurochrysis_carterae.AAC.1